MKDFLDDFQQTIERSAERLQLLSSTASETPRTPGKWSPREVIGHLIDSAANNHQRFVRAQFTDDLEFNGYEQAEWVDVQAYNREDWERLIQLWKLYNLHLLHLIERMPADQLTKLRRKHNLHEIAWQPVPITEPRDAGIFHPRLPGTLEASFAPDCWRLKLAWII